MADEQNVDISDLLKHAKTTAELHANLLLYTPSQHRLDYDHGFLERFLGVVRTMVSVIVSIFTYKRVRLIGVII